MCVYNLPPWLCHKWKYLLLTTLISSSTQAGIDTDGFLEPLMQDMQKLWEHGVCRCFLYRQDIGWSRWRVHIPKWSCDIWRTIKHTIVYPALGPCYEVIALCPAFFVLNKKNNVTMGRAEGSKILLSEKGKCLVPPAWWAGAFYRWEVAG
jgi:hypothetical protein